MDRLALPDTRSYRLFFDKTLWIRALPEHLAWPFSLDEPALDEPLAENAFVHVCMEDNHNTTHELYYEHALQETGVAAFHDAEFVYVVVDARKSPRIAELRCPHVPTSWNRLQFYIKTDGASDRGPYVSFDETGAQVAVDGWTVSHDVAHARTAHDGYRIALRLPRDEIAPLLDGRQGTGFNIDRVDSETGCLSAFACAQQWAVGDVRRMARPVLLPPGADGPDGVHVHRVDMDMNDATGVLTIRATVRNADTTTPPVMHVIHDMPDGSARVVDGVWKDGRAVFAFPPGEHMHLAADGSARGPFEKNLCFTFGEQSFDDVCVFRYHSADRFDTLPVHDLTPPDRPPKPVDFTRADAILAEQLDDGSWPKEAPRHVVGWGLRQVRRALSNSLVMLRASREPGGERFAAPAMKGLEHVLSLQDDNGVWKNYDCDGNDTGVWGLSYHNGPIGTHMVELWEETGDERFLTAARRLLSWCDAEFPIDTNNNYDAFMLPFFAALYRVEQDASILDRAVHHIRFGSTRGQILDGSFPGHNHYGWYHDITMRGLETVLAVMPEDHPARPGVMRSFIRGVNRTLRRQRPDGNFDSTVGRFGDQFYQCYRERMLFADRLVPDSGLAPQIRFAYYAVSMDPKYRAWERERTEAAAR